MTGLVLVTAALQQLGVLGQGETPSTSEQTDGLEIANFLITSYSTERLNLPGVIEYNYAMTTGNGQVTIGPSAANIVAINSTAPPQLETVAVEFGGTRQTLEAIDSREWYRIQNLNATSVIPTRYFYRRLAITSPHAGEINCWPVPLVSVPGNTSLRVVAWQPLPTFALIGTDLTYYDNIPGMKRMLVLNLAIELAAPFGSRVTVDMPQLIDRAAEAKAAVRMLNGAAPGQNPVGGQISAIVQGGPPAGGLNP